MLGSDWRGNSKNFRLMSSFTANAALKAGFNLLEAELNELPALKELANGTRLAYALLDRREGKEVSDADIIFDRNCIKYAFYFDKPDGGKYAAELAKFISLLAYVNGFYSIDFSSLYRYIIEGLTHASPEITDAARMGPLTERIKALTEVNLGLSHKLRELRAEVAALHEERGGYKKRLQELTEWLRKNKQADLGWLGGTIGIGKGELKSGAGEF